MKVQKNAYKAWSSWGLALIAAMEGIKGSWPLLAQQLPEPVYDWGLFAMAIFVLFLRFVDQGLANENQNSRVD